ncbi:Crp/Fnr family transcriptional regulator [Yoonia sp. GPGPB17]|uniref:Crp/Fnr family transcriptional regulator n=1 Tax=Yoonia sp. GPGPB17 TaxID=3026147 RepID=UPI0030BBE0EA
MAVKDVTQQSLKDCTLLRGIDERALDAVLQEMEVLSVPRGKLIMMHGDTTTETYFLLSGSVIGQIVAETGREILFTEIAEGGYFGELAALDGKARSIAISAHSDCVLGKLRGPTFLKLLRAYPQIAINLATDLGARLRNMNDRVFGLVVYDVETRVRVRLMQLAQEQEQLLDGGVIANAPTHEVISNFIGANREAVSRVIAKLNRAGVIAAKRGEIRINDVETLMDVQD